MLRVRQFRAGGCYSYLVYEPRAHESAIIDPVLSNTEAIAGAVKELGLKNLWIMDTHTHADHASGTLALAERVGGTVALSAHSKSQRAKKQLREGDTISVGGQIGRVLEVPGHTVDSLAFAFDGFVFTGDTLFNGTTARTDFPGSSPEDLFDSVTKKIFVLPDATLVYPGHDYNDRLFSSVGIEKRDNAEMKKSRADFAAFKRAQNFPDQSAEIQKMIRFNNSTEAGAATGGSGVSCAMCGAPTSGGAKVAEIDPGAFWEREQKEKLAFADVREDSELKSGRYPRARHFRLSELGSFTEEKSFASAPAWYMACGSGKRSVMAAKTLAPFGIDVVSVIGGMQEWKKRGLPVDV